MKNPSQDRRNSSAHESGQATLELAFCLPIFVILALGGAEIGNLAWASVQINNAARAGAAFASISHANAIDLTDIQIAAQNEAPKLITDPTTQVTSTQVCSCIDSTGAATALTCDDNALTNCPSPSTIFLSVQVNTTAPVSTLVHLAGLPATYTVSAQATVGVKP